MTTTSLACPSCGLGLDETISVHHSSEGLVGYRRCVCGRWAITVAGRVVGEAGTSDFERMTALSPAVIRHLE